MDQAIDRRHQSLDALRIQAEIETAARVSSKRPTWAPAVVLDGELLEVCRELEYLAADDKPVARLWAVFADPKRKGTVIRVTYSRHALPGIRCRGFELRAGIKHDGGRMTNAFMSDIGNWSIGQIFWEHSDVDQMRRSARSYEQSIADIHRQLKPSPPPQPMAPEEIYNHTIAGGHGMEEAQRRQEATRKFNAAHLERWKAREQKKQDPDFIALMHEYEAKNVAWLEKLRPKIAKEEANPDWRYRALTRITELATLRLLTFVGDPQIERECGSRLTGSCYICGKTLTDKLSLERGIGPECIKYLRTFDLTDLVRLKNEMVAAHPDKRGRHEAFLRLMPDTPRPRRPLSEV